MVEAIAQNNTGFLGDRYIFSEINQVPLNHPLRYPLVALVFGVFCFFWEYQQDTRKKKPGCVNILVHLLLLILP